MQLNLHIDILQWIDDNRGKMSRQAFINALLKKEYTLHTIPTKENNDELYLRNGASDAPQQV